MVLNLLDRGAGLAKVGELQGHAAAALGQLQCGVDAAGDGLHVVFDTQKEAGDEFASCGLTGVEEGRGCGLEAPGHHFVDQVSRHFDIALCQVERDHDDAVFEALEVAGPVEGLERVRGVVLEGAQEGGETELVGVGLLVEVLNVLEVVLVEDVLLVVALLDQVFHLLFQVVEEHGVLVDVLEEVLACCLSVGLELDLAIRIVEVELRVERVVIQLGGGGWFYSCVSEVFCQNSLNPSRTRETSSAVPRSSNLYMWGMCNFAEMMSPARQ